MKIPDVFFVLIWAILSTVEASFSDMSIPPHLQDCYSRLSRSSDSYPIFSPASRQRYCVKQYLNRRRREEWSRQSPVVPERDEFKSPDLTPFQPLINVNPLFWSPPLQQWRYPIVNNFWRGKMQYWPAAQPSFNQVWKPAARVRPLGKTWKTNSLFQSQNSKSISSGSASSGSASSGSASSGSRFSMTTIAPKTSAFRTTTAAPVNWNRKQISSNIQQNPLQRKRYWMAPVWSVVPNYLKVPRTQFNNQWMYPNLALNKPWDRFDNVYNMPEYPVIPMETIPKWNNK